MPYKKKIFIDRQGNITLPQSLPSREGNIWSLALPKAPTFGWGRGLGEGYFDTVTESLRCRYIFEMDSNHIMHLILRRHAGSLPGLLPKCYNTA